MASTLVTPELISQPWGFAASDPTYINLPIPVPSQISTTVNAASFHDGFPPSTMTPEASGGLPFFGQDMNGILYMITAYCANFAAGALPTYNSTLSSDISGYPAGVVLVNSGGTGLWINQTSGNTTNPDTGGAGWLPLPTVGSGTVTLAGSPVTLTVAEYVLPFLIFAGTLTANVVVTFPTTSGQQWIVANTCAGAYTVTCKTAAGSGVVIPATGTAAPTSIYCDGTNIQNTGVSTAGLAPLASPALTGTPTAPTASPATTNTTQIATTAFAQAAIAAALTAYAPLASPIFSGNPTAPTPASTDSSLKLATTAFVKAVAGISAVALSGVNGGINFSVSGTSIQIRWGLGTFGNGGVAVAFPTPFTTGAYAVVATRVGAVDNAPAYGVSNLTRTGFTGYCNTSDFLTSYYIAVGY